MTISSDAINCHAMQLDDRILAQPPRGSPQQIGNCGRNILYCGQELCPEYRDFWSLRARSGNYKSLLQAGRAVSIAHSPESGSINRCKIRDRAISRHYRSQIYYISCCIYIG